MAGEEHEVVGAVPSLDGVQTLVDLLPQRFAVQIASEEDRLYGAVWRVNLGETGGGDRNGMRRPVGLDPTFMSPSAI